jgi:hypothetical protein
MGSLKNNVPPSYRIEECCQLSIGFWMKNRFPWGSIIVPNHLNLGSHCILCFNLLLKTWMIWFLSKWSWFSILNLEPRLLSYDIQWGGIRSFFFLVEKKHVIHIFKWLMNFHYFACACNLWVFTMWIKLSLFGLVLFWSMSSSAQYMTLRKYFSLSYVFFCNPTHKTETRTPNR